MNNELIQLYQHVFTAEQRAVLREKAENGLVVGSYGFTMLVFEQEGQFYFFADITQRLTLFDLVDMRVRRVCECPLTAVLGYAKAVDAYSRHELCQSFAKAYDTEVEQQVHTPNPRPEDLFMIGSDVILQLEEAIGQAA